MTISEYSSLDSLDYRILRILASQGRSSDVGIGDVVGLSSNAVARRRRQMEDNGLIRGYSVDLDMDHAGYGILILVQIELIAQTDKAIAEFEAAICQCESVSKCWFVSGDVDFLALVHAASLNDYEQTYRQQFSSLPNVSKIRSSFVLRRVIDRSVAPVVLNEQGHRDKTDARRR